MNFRVFLVFVVLLFLMGCDQKSLPTHTIQICNENATNYIYIFSVGYFDKVKDNWVSKGWYTIKPKQCVTPINARHGGKLYLHGRYRLFKDKKISDGSFLGDIGELVGDLVVAESITKIEGNKILCVHPKNAFEVFGNTRCVSRGYKSDGFFEIEIKSHDDTLIEFYNGGKFSKSFK